MDLVDPPTCHGQPMRPIVYGMPGPELVEASAQGLIELGGCCISDDMPAWRCRVCGARADGSGTSARTGDGG